jgi:preprotein translocase subunit SecD
VSSNRALAFREKPASEATKSAERQVLVVLSPDDVNRHDIAKVYPGLDERDRPTVFFTMTRPGAEKLARLTGNNVPDSARETLQLGIFINGALFSAPAIQSVVSERGMITGDFTRAEVEELVVVLSVSKIVKAEVTGK